MLAKCLPRTFFHAGPQHSPWPADNHHMRNELPRELLELAHRAYQRWSWTGEGWALVVYEDLTDLAVMAYMEVESRTGDPPPLPIKPGRQNLN